MPFWDERVEEIASSYPEVSWDKYHIDILTAHFVLNPDRFDVDVASNLFGDILSDLGPACTGTIGIAPSGNINPERRYPSLFEPVHGSAPDIAGQGIANPIGQIWAGAMMLEHLGHAEAAAGVELTESMAMWPGSSVSGLYIGHPEAYYFGVAKVERDQVADYAERKGMTLEEAERWLAPILNYQPGGTAEVIAAE